jgi:hypothetical protein
MGNAMTIKRASVVTVIATLCVCSAELLASPLESGGLARQIDEVAKGITAADQQVKANEGAKAKSSDEKAMDAYNEKLLEKHPPGITAHQVTKEYQAADQATKDAVDARVKLQHEIREAAKNGTLPEQMRVEMGISQKTSPPSSPRTEGPPHGDGSKHEGITIDHPGKGERNDAVVHDDVKNTA